MTAQIIPLTPQSKPPPLSPDQLYREAAWRFLRLCFLGASPTPIRMAAEEMRAAKSKVNQ